MAAPEEARSPALSRGICRACFSTQTAKLVLIRQEVEQLLRESASHLHVVSGSDRTCYLSPSTCEPRPSFASIGKAVLRDEQGGPHFFLLQRGSLKFQTQTSTFNQRTCFESPNNLHASKIKLLLLLYSSSYIGDSKTNKRTDRSCLDKDL